MEIFHKCQDELSGQYVPCHAEVADQPLTSWWGKRFGIAPSASVTSRQSTKYRDNTNIQEYETIVKKCRATDILWEDPQFPAEDLSIFYSRALPKPFEWRRPTELVEFPKFIKDDASRFDIKQGELGDCWLLAAVANLTLHPTLLAKVVPMEQNFDDGYCGVFHFQFWQYGHWVDVVVDDRLPTYNGRLVFMHSDTLEEFWSALLEKAYAKLCGSYEALKGGSAAESMEDFTGGLAEVFELKESVPSKLFQILRKAFERKSLISCSIEQSGGVFQKKLPNGLVEGHAYSITDVRTVHVTLPNGKTGDVEMIRIRNPWGGEVEWNGAWSDGSPEWTCVSDAEKKEVGLVFAHDGEFWMSYRDFRSRWHKVEVCHISAEDATTVAAISDSIQFNSKKSWKSQSFEGAWTKGATAGGCRNYLDKPPKTFSYNPQYRITLHDCDDADDKCTCVIALMQKNRRRVKQTAAGADFLTIGYAVYKLTDDHSVEDSSPLPAEFFRSFVSVAKTQAFINIREVCCRFLLPPGNYVIVPSTFEPNEEGEFMIRVFSEKDVEASHMDRQASYKPPPPPKRTEQSDEANDRLERFFEKLSGEDLEIDAWELQKILSYAFKKEFAFENVCVDTCRSMIACVDMSRTGKLDLGEFKELWAIIRVWKTAFRRHDTDKSGYTLPSRVIRTLVLRYANKEGQIDFDSYIGCAVKLKTMMDIFNERDPRNKGKAEFDLASWIELTMYA